MSVRGLHHELSRVRQTLFCDWQDGAKAEDLIIALADRTLLAKRVIREEYRAIKDIIDKPVLTSAEASLVSCAHPSTVKVWNSSGELGERRGSLYLVDREALVAKLREQLDDGRARDIEVKGITKTIPGWARWLQVSRQRAYKLDQDGMLKERIRRELREREPEHV